jgi:two-component system, LuxR family, sensor kinase FixL
VEPADRLFHPSLRFDATLVSRRSLLLLAAVAVASTAVVGGAYVAMLVAFGLLPAADFGRAALRFWMGDVIGITVLTPFLLVLMTRRRLMAPSWEALALVALVLGALWVVFGFAEAFRFQLSTCSSSPWSGPLFGSGSRE